MRRNAPPPLVTIVQKHPLYACAFASPMFSGDACVASPHSNRHTTNWLIAHSPWTTAWKRIVWPLAMGGT